MNIHLKLLVTMVAVSAVYFSPSHAMQHGETGEVQEEVPQKLTTFGGKPLPGQSGAPKEVPAGITLKKGEKYRVNGKVIAVYNYFLKEGDIIEIEGSCDEILGVKNLREALIRGKLPNTAWSYILFIGCDMQLSESDYSDCMLIYGGPEYRMKFLAILERYRANYLGPFYYAHVLYDNSAQKREIAAILLRLHEKGDYKKIEEFHKFLAVLMKREPNYLSLCIHPSWLDKI